MTDAELAEALNLPLEKIIASREKAELIVKIQKAKIAADLSDKDLALKSGVPLNTMVGILAGTREDVGMEDLQRLAQALSE